MKAVLIIPEPAEFGPPNSGNRHVSVMATLIDRPFIRHVIEYIVDQGIRRIELVMNPSNTEVCSLVADGRRWGGEFQCRFADSTEQAYALTESLAGDDTKFLLAHADRLPLVDLREILQSNEGVLFHSTHEERSCWTGWAVLPGENIRGISGVRSEAQLLSHLERKQRTRVLTTKELRTGTERHLWKAHCDALAANLSGILYTGREVSTGVWVGRNASVHPTAKVTPPAYIGENTRIGAAAQIGPYAVVGSDCLIARRTVITNSVVCPGTYVGSNLEIDHAVAEKGRLFDIRLDAAVSEVDEVLLDGLFDFSVKSWAGRLPGRLAAASMLALTGVPLGLYALWSLYWNGRSPWTEESFLRVPAVHDPSRWSTFNTWALRPAGVQDEDSTIARFWHRFLPSLVSVVKGDVDLFGVRPLTPDVVAAMPPAIRSAYLRSKVGALGWLRGIPGHSAGSVLAAANAGSAEPGRVSLRTEGTQLISTAEENLV